jgi:hypothetical protein
MSPEAKAAQRRKEGLKRRMRDLNERAEDLDFEPAKRTEPVRDAEELKLRGEIGRIKDEYAFLLERAARRNRPLGRKILDTAVEAERSIKLTGITTLGKLMAAGGTRLVTTPVEEIVGGILSKLPYYEKSPLPLRVRVDSARERKCER